MKQKKQCESCQHFGKGECDYVKCYKNSWCDWEEIKKPKELEWEKDLLEQLNKPKSLFSDKNRWIIEYVKSLLTQQRTELLEEIKEREIKSRFK